ncbi:DUF4199 domain-containing protein, partial [Aquimarina sp. D1M17]|uniref:DUF4199 domain-containing protein n=1 Tax=Aquimarina acroporae TaxID=2937283 RepID=UPI0020BF8BA4
METKKTSINKHIIKYGVIYGCIWLLYRVLIYLIFNSLSAPKKWNTEAIIIELFFYIGGIPYCIYKFKKNNNGFLQFSEAIKIGIGMSVYIFIFSVIWLLFYKNVIDTDFATNILERNRKQSILNNPELSPKEIDDMKSKTENNFLSIMHLYKLLFYIAFSSSISCVAGAIMN